MPTQRVQRTCSNLNKNDFGILHFGTTLATQAHGACAAHKGPPPCPPEGPTIEGVIRLEGVNFPRYLLLSSTLFYLPTTPQYAIVEF